MIGYLVGPVDYEQDQSWKIDIFDKLKVLDKLIFYDPSSHFKFNEVTDELSIFIYEVNKIVMCKSDFILMRWFKNQQSVGTPIELSIAKNLDIPMIIITDMYDSVYMRYMAIDNIIVEDLDTATKVLRNTYNYIYDTEGKKSRM